MNSLGKTKLNYVSSKHSGLSINNTEFLNTTSRQRGEKKKLQSQFHAPVVPMGRKRARCCEMCRRRWWRRQGNKWRKKVSQFPPSFGTCIFGLTIPPPSFLSIPGAKFPSFLPSPHPISLYEKVLRRAGAVDTWAQQTQGNLINEACSIFSPCVFCGKTNLPCKIFFVAHPRLCMREILRLCLRGRA